MAEFQTPVTRTQAIKNFLTVHTHADLAAMYNHDMECQVNVAQEGGEPIKESYKGKQWRGFTDGIITWKSFRIPLFAKSNPQFVDGPMMFPLDKFSEGIGMTGWDWKNKVSRWVAFDFDAISGHAEAHKKKLTQDELEELVEKVREISWVQVRRSTSGSGLHLYTFLPNVPTENHTEHAALARAVLGKLSATAGFDFAAKVDICGGNMWIWHRKMKGTDGLTLVKQHTEVLEKYPQNWRDHLTVVTSKAVRAKASLGLDSETQGSLENLIAQTAKANLDVDHRRLLVFLDKNNLPHSWDADRDMLVCHTWHLKDAHQALNFKGIYDTSSTGSSEMNCFAFPLKNGAWVVRRFTQGTAEHNSWIQDSQGWTKIYYNRDPDLRTLVVMYGGMETPKDGFYIPKSDNLNHILKGLGSFITIPPDLMNRESWIKQHKDNNKIIVEIASQQVDRIDTSLGWYLDKSKRHTKVITISGTVAEQDESSQFDDVVRHVITVDGEDNGWFIRSNGWVREPFTHVKTALKSLDGLKDTDVNKIMGSSLFNAWTEVNQPFQPEYPGDRKWNRNACQLRFVPTQETDDLKFPTWMKVLNHIGKNLQVQDDAWCKAHGIDTGADYLLCWIACLFKFPYEPLPYMFLYGPQNAGKSVLYESIQKLMTNGGVVHANQALESDGGFNGELANAILCYAEELNLNNSKGRAYNRMKDWVTSRMLNVHPKGGTPYMQRNTTHWLQCANDRSYCPIGMGDSRITMIRVDEVDLMDRVPKNKLETDLESEAPDFLAHIMQLELPPTNDRLRIPVVKTSEKTAAEEFSGNDVEMFLSKLHYRPGHAIKFSKLWEAFSESPEVVDKLKWTKKKFSAEISKTGRYPIGKSMTKNNQTYVGNISTEPPEAGEHREPCQLNALGVFVKTEGLTWEE